MSWERIWNVAKKESGSSRDGVEHVFLDKIIEHLWNAIPGQLWTNVYSPDREWMTNKARIQPKLVKQWVLLGYLKTLARGSLQDQKQAKDNCFTKGQLNMVAQLTKAGKWSEPQNL